MEILKELKEMSIQDLLFDHVVGCGKKLELSSGGACDGMRKSVADFDG